MHRTRKSDSLIAVSTALFLIVHLIVLGGLSIRGVMNALQAHLFLDFIYGVLLVLLGVIFAIIVTRSTIPYFKDGAWSMIRTLYKRNKHILLASGFITVFQYFLRDNFFNTLTHGGFLFGSYVLGQTRLGLLRALGIDVFDYGLENLAWVMQFYLLLLIIGWIGNIWKTKNRH